jgi:hypothetical protein
MAKALPNRNLYVRKEKKKKRKKKEKEKEKDHRRFC